jgi:ABC-2 type transport system permease protein
MGGMAVLIGVLGEMRKGLLISWAYRVNTFAGTLTLGFIFVSIGFLLGGGILASQDLAPALLGYLTWVFVSSAVSDLSYGLQAEITAGTLEQMVMSTTPVGLLLIGRVLANMIVSAVQVGLMAIAMTVLLGVRIPFRWQGLPVLAMTLVGVFGFGFVVAGATLVLKQIQSVINLVNNALAFLNGTFLPVAAMPGWMAVISRVLPSTQGVIVLRQVVLEGYSLGAVWRGRSLVWLAVHSVLYFAVGWLVFLRCERLAKQHGSLGRY